MLFADNALLILSGAAGLIYQVAWVRVLGLSMGATTASVSTVLCAFFLGLTAGSALAGRLIRGRRAKRSSVFSEMLRLYAVVELVVGVSGLVLLPALLELDAAVAHWPLIGQSIAFKFVVATVLLIVPTTAMGTTFPIIAAAWVGRRGQVGGTLGRLYGLNTLGAVGGALGSGFILIPRVGLDGAVMSAAALNFVAAGLAFWVAGRTRQDDLSETVCSGAAEKLASSVRRSDVRPALALFVTGAVALASEVAWTKYLSIFTGTTIYGFSAILAAFLVGVAVGSWATKRPLSRLMERGSSARSAAWFVGGALLLALSLLMVRAVLAFLPAVFRGVNEAGLSVGMFHLAKYGVVAGILFVPAFFFGALFPLTLSMYCGERADVRARIGRGYAINTLGSIAGILATGFWLVPSIGTDGTLLAGVVVTIALAVFYIPAIGSAPDARNVKPAAIAGAALLAVGCWVTPGLDYRDLIAARRYRFDMNALAGKEPRFLFLEEGHSGVVSLVTYDGVSAVLQSNGIRESFLSMSGKGVPPKAETLLGLAPYFLHPAPETAFVVGFGGGHTVRALTLTPVRSIRAVELEEAIVSAVNTLSPPRPSVLQDPRVELSLNDARNTLLVERTKYDLIASQPSHPWLSGAGNLFTKRFFEIVRSRLNPGGIYAQWVNLFNMDVTTLRSILKAFFQIFPHGFVMSQVPTGDLLLFGSTEPLVFDIQQVRIRMAAPAVASTLRKWQIDQPEALLGFFSLSRAQALDLSADVEANTDTRLISEVRLAGLTADPEGAENPYAWLRKNETMDVVGYLPKETAGATLLETARYFVRWDSVRRFALTLKRLQEIDPERAARLEAEILGLPE